MNPVFKIQVRTLMYNETSSLLKQLHMAEYFYWGPSLLGAEFVRGRVCQGLRCPGIPAGGCETPCSSVGEILDELQ